MFVEQLPNLRDSGVGDSVSVEEWKDSQVGEGYNVSTKENKVVGARDSANSCRARHSPGYSPEERNSFLGSRLGTVIVLSGIRGQKDDLTRHSVGRRSIN